MKRLALLAAAFVGITGVAYAQSPATSTSTPHASYPEQAQQYQSDRGCGHQVAITDEYGFKYDGMGDRLNAQGCVIRPPHTPPGGRAIKG